MNKQVTVTELVAFAKCGRKAELIQQGAPQDSHRYEKRSPAEQGVITHAIIHRKNLTRR
ncbi:MAG: hypothetical protein PHV02_03120 [Rhodocyclaceae bacterium]|nr:hypothetical protein [Rhodocyclaceae bacterium]